MGLKGTGAVAIWHDIEPMAREQFYAWHGSEHMPERVGIPGFLRGRRYVAIEPAAAEGIEARLEYFNLYETASPEVVKGVDYQQRLDNPTPWTVSTVKHFRRVARSLCEVAYSHGRGQGGLVLTCRYDVAKERAGKHLDELAHRALDALAGHPCVAGVHVLIADADASAVDSAERRARGEPNAIPPWITVIEGWGDLQAFALLCRDALTDSAFIESGAVGPIEQGLYRLQVTAVP